MSGSFRRLDFAVPALDPPIRGLSGGNLQRAVIAREMAHEPRLIVALYPTRGLDVRSALSVRDLLLKVRNSGSGVLLISEDLEELAEMSDRLLVMYGGALVGEFAKGAWHAEVVGHLMTGSTGGRSCRLTRRARLTRADKACVAPRGSPSFVPFSAPPSSASPRLPFSRSCSWSPARIR